MHEQMTHEVIPVTCLEVARGTLPGIVGVVNAAMQEVQCLVAKHRAAHAQKRLASLHQLFQYRLVAVSIQNLFRSFADC